MKCISVVLGMLLCFIMRMSSASENSNDTYLYRDYCPDTQSVTREGQSAAFPGAVVNGGTFYYVPSDSRGSWITKSFFKDKWGFAQCNCTSYVADQLNQLWSRAPAFGNGYYNLQDSNGKSISWSHARYWHNRAISAGIGVTGASDNFKWEEFPSYNAVFPGDVAWWDKWNETSGQFGHVAVVVSSEKDLPGKGVKCVTIRQYNWFGNNFNETRLCKGQKDENGEPFPDAFLHIDQDHIYCLDHFDQCPGFSSGTGGVGGRGGSGIGGGTDLFNLKLNRFWTRDIATGLDIDSDTGSVRTGQAISVRMQVKALNGDTHDHMQKGKDTIELDFYAREDLGEWYFLKREYIQATNLPNDATHTEHVDYVVPAGVSEVSFQGEGGC